MNVAVTSNAPPCRHTVPSQGMVELRPSATACLFCERDRLRAALDRIATQCEASVAEHCADMTGHQFCEQFGCVDIAEIATIAREALA